jgi:hypothetical protein
MANTYIVTGQKNWLNRLIARELEKKIIALDIQNECLLELDNINNGEIKDQIELLEEFSGSNIYLILDKIKAEDFFKTDEVDKYNKVKHRFFTLQNIPENIKPNLLKTINQENSVSTV